MHGSAPSRVSFGLKPRRLERGKRARWRAAGLDWTGPRASTTLPSCHVTSAIARSLRPCRTILTVAARRAGRPTITETGASAQPPANDPPSAGSIPSLSSPARSRPPSRPSATRQHRGPARDRFSQPAWDASVDPANGSPAAGSRLCSSPPARSCCFSRSRQRPDSRRVPTVSELAGSEVPP
jgi:hypothetical protein